MSTAGGKRAPVATERDAASATTAKSIEYALCRPDLLTTRGFGRLLVARRVPVPQPFGVCAAIVESELGDAGRSLVERMEHQPLATGWFTQTYLATRDDGHRAVVKVRLDVPATAGRRRLPVPKDLLEELADGIDADRAWYDDLLHDIATEDDLRLEASNTIRLSRLEDRSETRVPAVAEALTTRRVLVREALPGATVGEMLRKHLEGDRSEVARQLLASLLDQAIGLGLLHGLPHPDNLVVAEDASIGVVDVPTLVRVDPDARSHLERGMRALFEGDVTAFAAALADVARWDDPEGPRALRRVVSDELHRAETEAAGEKVPVERAVRLALRALARQRVGLPPAVAAAYRHLALVDAVARRLDPSFDAGSTGLRRLADLSARSFVERASDPDRIQLQVFDYLRTAVEAPDRLRGLLDDLQDNRLVVPVVTSEGEDQQRRSNARAKLVAVAALSVGVAVLLLAVRETRLWGVPAEGFAWAALIFLYVWFYLLIKRLR